MAFVSTTWAYQEVVSSSKLQQMSDNDDYLKGKVDMILAPGDDTVWATLPYVATWSDYVGATAATGTPANFAGARHRRKSGLVVVEGAVQKSAAVTVGETVAVLPIGHRPPVPTPLYTSAGQTVVLPDGRIIVQVAAGNIFTISGVFGT